jgi:hypothetical protein
MKELNFIFEPGALTGFPQARVEERIAAIPKKQLRRFWTFVQNDASYGMKNRLTADSCEPIRFKTTIRGG